MSDLVLRRARSHDLDALYRLLRERNVYLYLADDREPSRGFVAAWLEAGIAHFETLGVGLWLLEDATATAGDLAGLVLLEPTEDRRRVELSYVLHADYRGRGLATSMAISAIRYAFDRAGFSEVVAGADLPNTDSFAVMERLGMTKWREMIYPKYPGFEYRITREERRVEPGVTLPIVD